MRKPFEALWEVMEARRQQLEMGEVPSVYRPEHLRQQARRARGCPDTEALCGWLDGQLRRRNLRRWLTVWRHIRLHGCRGECQAGLALIAAAVRPTGAAQSADQQGSGGRGQAPKRSLSSFRLAKGPLAWVSGVSVVAVGLSLWLPSQDVGKERPQPPFEHATNSQAVRPIIWGD